MITVELGAEALIGEDRLLARLQELWSWRLAGRALAHPLPAAPGAGAPQPRQPRASAWEGAHPETRRAGRPRVLSPGCAFGGRKPSLWLRSCSPEGSSPPLAKTLVRSRRAARSVLSPVLQLFDLEANRGFGKFTCGHSDPIWSLGWLGTFSRIGSFAPDNTPPHDSGREDCVTIGLKYWSQQSQQQPTFEEHLHASGLLTSNVPFQQPYEVCIMW